MKDENRNKNSVDDLTEPSSRVQAEGFSPKSCSRLPFGVKSFYTQKQDRSTLRLCN